MSDKLPPGAVRLFSTLNASEVTDVPAQQGLIVAWSPSYLEALASVLGLSTTQPSPARVWTGGVDSAGFKVNFDLTATNPALILTAGLVVSENADMSDPVFTATPVAPTITSGRSGSYRTAAFTVTGLAADTLYHFVPVVNGAQASAFKGTVRTAPSVGTATSFSFVTSSCIAYTASLNPPWEAIAAESPAFLLFTGDIDYPDVSVNNPAIQRDRNTRTFRNMSGVQAMNLTVPFVYMFDDHDSAGDDSNWDTLYPSNATNDEIVTNSRLVYRETTPHYPTWDDKVLGQSWTWGRCRFVMPDLHSQRRFKVGTPTILGNGTNPPGSYDQLSKVLAEIAQADADGVKVLFFVSSSTWAPAVFDSWQTEYTLEQGLVADAIRDANVQVWFIHGDCHQMVIDDGTTTDRSTTLTAKYPLVAASSLFQPAVNNAIKGTTWDGGDGNITGPVPTNNPPGTGNATAYAVFSVEDNGGDDIHVQVVFKGAPISGASATVLGGQAAYRDDDAARVVSFPSADTLYIQGGKDSEIDINKTWFGACSATGVYTSGRAAPTVVWKPNSSRLTLPYPYVAGAADTLTLSAPVGCTLGAFTTQNIDYFTPNAATLAYTAEFDTPLSTSQFYALDVMIVGLIADGVWAKLVKAWWLGAPTQQASLLNMVTPSDPAPVPTNGPVFAPLQGWRGNGRISVETSVSYLETGYAIPGGMQNDISMFVWTLDAEQGAGDMGGGNYYISSTYSITDDIRFRSSSSTTDSVPPPTGVPVSGFIGWSRTGSANYTPYYNGSALSVVTRASAAPGATTMWLAGFQNPADPTVQQSSPRRNAFAIIAGGLTGTEVGDLYARLNTFLRAVGTIS